MKENETGMFLVPTPLMILLVLENPVRQEREIFISIRRKKEKAVCLYL